MKKTAYLLASAASLLLLAGCNQSTSNTPGAASIAPFLHAGESVCLHNQAFLPQSGEPVKILQVSGNFAKVASADTHSGRWINLSNIFRIETHSHC